MALFGKKKLSLAEILKGVEALSEEEKEQVLSAIQQSEEAVEPELEKAETAEVEVEENEGEPVEEIDGEMTESEEVQEPFDEAEVDMMEEDVEEPVEEPVEENPMPDVPSETPEANQTEEGEHNSDELVAAMNARMDSLESAVNALMERLEQVVMNQDKQNFGYSPSKNFGGEESSSRMSAVMQGYAPRRAEQYK